MGEYQITYRWSLRRTYTVEADTELAALDAADEQWAQDDGSDMAGEPDAFAIPNWAPDDVIVDWQGEGNDE